MNSPSSLAIEIKQQFRPTLTSCSPPHPSPPPTSFRPTTDDTAKELFELRKRVVQLEYERAVDLEAKVHDVVKTQDQLLNSWKENERLKSKIFTMDEELKLAQHSEIQCRNDANEAKSNEVQLQASLAVLEARLDASARREMALDTMVRKLQQTSFTCSPLPTIQDLIELHTSEEIKAKRENNEFKLEIARMGEENLLLKQTFQLEKEISSKTESSRVGFAKRADELEVRLEHSKSQNKALMKQVALLNERLTECDKLANTTQIELKQSIALVQSQENQIRIHQNRVFDSNSAFFARKLVDLMKSSANDIEALVCLVDAGMGNVELDMDVILGSNRVAFMRALEENPEQFLGYFISLTTRASKARLRAVDAIASKSSKGSNDAKQQQRNFEHLSLSDRADGGPQGNCGVQ